MKLTLFFKFIIKFIKSCTISQTSRSKQSQDLPSTQSGDPEPKILKSEVDSANRRMKNSKIFCRKLKKYYESSKLNLEEKGAQSANYSPYISWPISIRPLKVLSE